MQPRLFAPGVVSTDGAAELNGVFSPDGREFFFTRTEVLVEGGEGVSRMHRSVLGEDGVWDEPEFVQVWPGDAASLAVDMAYSPDGQRLYFLGDHPHERTGGEPNLDIWVTERTEDGGWSLARALGPPVWTEHSETYPAVTSDGGLQFSSSRPGGVGESRDLWRAAPDGRGGFLEPVNMGEPVNSAYAESDSCVSPDGSYIVFTSDRPGGPGSHDLYVSFRGEGEGEWSTPRLLGHGINTVDTDYCPMVTPDGKYLFFSRRISEPKDSGWAGLIGGNVYWVSTEVIEELRE